LIVLPPDTIFVQTEDVRAKAAPTVFTVIVRLPLPNVVIPDAKSHRVYLSLLMVQSTPSTKNINPVEV